MNTPLMRVENLKKVYGRGNNAVFALKGVNLNIPAGAFLTISGPSGSGKSTLLNMLGFVDHPTEGNIYFSDKIVSTKDFNTLADFRSKQIGFIFQSFNLIPILSAIENVMVPLMIRKDIPMKEKQDRCQELIDAVGLKDSAGQKPDQLSGGQKQRVAIARAMVSRPSVVLADEPTANLDSENSKMILEIMAKINQEDSTTFIFSSHDPIVFSFAKQSILLKDGKIVEQKGLQ